MRGSRSNRLELFLAKLPVLSALAALAALVMLAPVTSFAADPPPPNPAYEQHMASGAKLLEEESWVAAQAEFEAAYAVEPRAAPLLQIAICEQAEQHWPRAVAAMERALREHAGTLDDGEKKAAEQALAEMRAQMGTVQVVLAPGDATLRIDGEDQPPAGPQRVIVLGPGPHRLEGRLTGWSPAAQTVTIKGGDEVAIKLGLAPALPGAPVELSPGSDGAPISYPAGPQRTRRGPYGLLAFTTFVPLPPTDFTGTAVGFSGGVHLGYRFASVAGGELLFEYAHARATGQARSPFVETTSGPVPMSYGLSSVRAGLGLRLMTTGTHVRFVQVFGGGIMVDTLQWTPGAGAGAITRHDTHGADGFGMSETGVEFDVAHVLLGLTLQQILGSRGALALASHDDFAANAYSGPQYSLGIGLRGGYRLW